MVLDVHPGCEGKEKQQPDYWNRLLQDRHTQPREEWVKRGDLRNLPLRPELFIDPSEFTVVPVLNGLSPLLDGVWRWIRGFHAALYLGFLPQDLRKQVLGPFPQFGDPGGPTVQDVNAFSQVILSIVDRGISQDKWDGISAWGDQVRYKSIWHRITVSGERVWTCSWRLDFPGVTDWWRSICPEGSERPWHGSFLCSAPPASASFLDGEDFTSETNNP